MDMFSFLKKTALDIKVAQIISQERKRSAVRRISKNNGKSKAAFTFIVRTL